MRYLLLTAIATTLVAVDIGPAPPAPGTLPAPAQAPRTDTRANPSGAMMMRASPGFEVEQLLVTPGDAAGMAAWAELAARGYRLVAVAPQDGKQALFFERMLMPGTTDPQIPAAVAADPARAAQLKAALRTILSERQSTMPRPKPAPAPETKP